MTTNEMILDSDHFVMLDLVNTICGNQTAEVYPIVQIVDSSNKYSFQNIESIKSRIENRIQFEEKREDLFSITLSTDEDYKNQLFR